MKDSYPKKIICMTEESVELLYLLGEEHRIAGVSGFVRRPIEARSLPKISSFTHANIKKIKQIKPDLVLGFSDIQKDIAQELIGEGINVFISNQRSIEEILNYMLILGGVVGQQARAQAYVESCRSKILQFQSLTDQKPYRPRVYIEEWDSPMITGIHWFSELVEICGGRPIFVEKSRGVLAKDRFVSTDEIVESNPEVILACWCGKKVDINSILCREGWENVPAIKHGLIYELSPEIYLQPGPALFESGLEELSGLLGQISVKPS
jgi:iron complex transport system substrate-binding protein